MGQTPAYAVVRVHADSYRLDRLTPPGIGAAAFVLRFRDRLGNPLGWRLRPLAVMQGARSRVHPTAAAALASTKLLTHKQAEAAVVRANTALLAAGRDMGGFTRPPSDPLACLRSGRDALMAQARANRDASGDARRTLELVRQARNQQRKLLWLRRALGLAAMVP